jgi:excisionase family DNA binding protein
VYAIKPYLCGAFLRFFNVLEIVMPGYITAQQAAAYLSCSTQHIYNIRNKSKKLSPESIKLGNKLLFEKSTLDTWLRKYGDRT